MRADKSARLADSVLTACCLARRSSSSRGTLSLNASSRACASSCACCALLNWLVRLTRRASSGALSALRSAVKRSRRRLNERDCSSILRWSAASTCICCCTCATPVRCSLALACALRSNSSSAGNWLCCSSLCAASSSDFSSASIACVDKLSVSSAASCLRVAHCAVCSLSWLKRCSTRMRPSTTKRISASSRPTSALASYSLPCAWLTWSPDA